MRGSLVSILFAFLMILILAMIVLTGISIAQRAGEEQVIPALEEIFEPLRPYTFDINNYLVNISDRDRILANRLDYFRDQSNFCTTLKRCLLTSVRNKGTVCDIGTIELEDNNIAGFLASWSIQDYCADGPVREKFADGERTVCDFKKASLKIVDAFWENDSANPTNRSMMNPLYDQEPWTHGCWLHGGFSWPLTNTEYRYSPPFYYDPPDHTGDFEFKDTGGKVHMVLQNGTVNPDGTCSYNIFVCGQPAIGSTEDSVTARLFSVLYTGLDREMGCEEYQAESNCTPVQPYGYMPHYYELNYSAGEHTTPNAILAAVDAAFWEWTREHYYDGRLARSLPYPLNKAHGLRFSYAPWFALAYPIGSSVGDDDCWDIMNASRLGAQTRPLLYYYSGDDFTKATKIRLNIGIRKSYISVDAEGTDANNNGPACGGEDYKCGVGYTCGNVDDHKCCRPGYSVYQKSGGSHLCWPDQIELLPTVQVCAYS